ncbi:hypothetical protein ACFY7A_12640 [Streptomyces longwoodensis]|uniref:hypothetical protein n=1 Tax=Streptomyces longwoodensis TaxID=68231 RepID=UPI0036BB9C41
MTPAATPPCPQPLTHPTELIPHARERDLGLALSIPNDVRAVTVCRRTLRLILTLHGLIGLADTALGLVTACADLWGWQPSARFGARGKYVWCQLGPRLPGHDPVSTSG